MGAPNHWKAPAKDNIFVFLNVALARAGEAVDPRHTQVSGDAENYPNEHLGGGWGVNRSHPSSATRPDVNETGIHLPSASSRPRERCAAGNRQCSLTVGTGRR